MSVKEEAIGYCYSPRGAPTVDELAALCVYYDRVVLVPPAQSAFTVPEVRERIGDDEAMRQLSDLSHEAMSSLVQGAFKFYNAGMVAQQEASHTETFAAFVAKVLEAIHESHPEVPKSANEFLEYYDATVCLLFADAGRDLVVLSSSGQHLLPHPELDVGVAVVGAALPVAVAQDPSVVREIRACVRDSVESFKALVREKAYDVLGPEALSQPLRGSDPRLADLRLFVEQRIRQLVGESKQRLAELASQKRKAGASVAVGTLAGVGMLLNRSPIPGLASLVAVAPMARRWSDLIEQESEEKGAALSGPAGLFLSIEGLELD